MVQVEVVDGSLIWSQYAQSSVPREFEDIAFSRYGEPIEGLARSVAAVTEQIFPAGGTVAAPILLAADGCADDDGAAASRNCSRVCNDPAAMFSSWYNLWNCFTLAAMAVYVQNASLTPPSIAGLRAAGDHLGFGHLEVFNASSVIDSAITCAFRAAYDDLGYTPEAKQIPTDGAATPLENLTFFWTLPCFHVVNDLNSDIAGAGMLVAYFIQGFLAAYGWLLCGLLTGVPLAMGVIAHIILPRVTRRSSNRSSLPYLVGRAEAWAIRIEESRAGAALKTMLVDLQETQCFFALGTEIALTYAASQPAWFRGERTYQQLMYNQAFVRILAVMSLYSITLTQLALRRAGLSSVYTLVFAAAAVILKIVSNAATVAPGPERLWADFYGQNRLDECGKNTSPRTFCYVKTTPVEYLDQLTYYFSQVLPPALVVFLLLLLDKLPARLWEALHPSPHRRYHRQLRGMIRAVPRLLEVLYWGLEVFFFVLVCHGVDFLQSEVRSAVIRNSDESTAAGDFAPTGLLRFTSGQVIALMTWAPVMARYLYTTAFGFEHTSKTRIAAPFEIVKVRHRVTADAQVFPSRGAPGEGTELKELRVVGKRADTQSTRSTAFSMRET